MSLLHKQLQAFLAQHQPSSVLNSSPYLSAISWFNWIMTFSHSALITLCLCAGQYEWSEWSLLRCRLWNECLYWSLVFEETQLNILIYHADCGKSFFNTVIKHHRLTKSDLCVCVCVYECGSVCVADLRPTRTYTGRAGMWDPTSLICAIWWYFFLWDVLNYCRE